MGDLADRAVVLSSTKYHGLVRSDEYFKNRQIYSDDISGYKLVRRGWFAYATNHLAEGSIGLQKLVDMGCVSPVYTVFSCGPEVDVDFMYRVLKSDEMVNVYGAHDQASVDRRGAVRYGDFQKIEVMLPPLAEQRKIAEILDEVDSRIKALSAETAKLRVTGNALLEAALADALRPLRETEVSRLDRRVGEEAGGFRITTVGSLLESIEAGHSPDLEDKPAGEGQWGVLKVSAVGREGFRPRENKRVDDPSLIDSSTEVRPGDLLMTRANTPELVGTACVVERVRSGLMLSDKTLRLVMCDAGDPGFLALLLRQPELRKQIEIAATGTSNSMKNISQESIRNLVVPWPSKALQADVLSKSAAVSEERGRRHTEIGKLGLLKKSLMTDLLSGDTRVGV
ncbi:restriction endonuclease subunit S [Streptomyces sp. NPDC006655]|uniref:restriction endonuclease subunit S n=1 Tax=Streptomyces sp. NPDC006655 TaxID=3156898 RepID=UPI0034569B45